MSNEVSKRINRRELNILYIMTDEQPVSCVAGFGNPVIKTPNLDQLSKKAANWRRPISHRFLAVLPVPVNLQDADQYSECHRKTCASSSR
jgi:hypothetical protein